MPANAEMAKTRKKRLGKTSAVPKKYSKSDRKNGFRERAKTPVVISFPTLFSFNPKRSELPKCCRVVFKTKTERKTVKVPANLMNRESIRKSFKNSGSSENPVKGLEISVVNSRRRKTNTE